MANRSYLKSLIQSIGTNIFILASSLISSSLLAYMLGPDGRGKLAVILLWPMLFSSIGTLGLEKSIAYYSGKLRSRVNEVFFTGWLLLATLSIFVYWVGYYSIPYILSGKEASLIKTSQFCMLLIPIMFIGNLPYWVLQGLGRLKIWNSIRSLFIWLWIGVIIFAYLTNNITPYFIAKGYVFSMTVNCIIWLLVYFRIIKGPLKLNLSLIPRLLKYGLFSLLSILPNQFNLRLDQLIMSILLLPRDLGLYVVAVSWSGILSPVMIGFGQVAFPKMISSRGDDKIAEFRPILRYSILTGAFMALALIILTPFVFPLVFSSKFVAAIPAAMVLVVASFIRGLYTVMDEVIKGIGKPHISAISQFIGFGINVMIIVPILKYFGIMGASILSLTCYSIVFFAMIFILRKNFTFKFLELLPGKHEFIYAKEMLWGLVAKFKISGSKN